MLEKKACPWECGAELWEGVGAWGRDGRGEGEGRLIWGGGSEMGGRKEWGEEEQSLLGGRGGARWEPRDRKDPDFKGS